MEKPRILLVSLGTNLGKSVSRDVLYGAWCRGRKVANTEYPPLQILSLYTVLKQNGFGAVFFDALAKRLSFQEIMVALDFSSFDFVAVQTSTASFEDDCFFLSMCKKKNPAIKSIVFGSHVSFMPEQSMENIAIDFILFFEPEKVILGLLDAIEKGGLRKTRGICFRDGKKVVVNRARVLQPLDSLPIPDRSPILGNVYNNPIVSDEKWTTMEASRGCPSKCFFCTAPNFFEIVRVKSVSRVLEELEYLKSLGYREIFFRDEIFTLDRKRTIEICRGIVERKLGLKWICNSKIGMIDFELMKIMKAAGLRQLLFGIESGSEEILKGLGKPMSLEEAKNVFGWARALGIRTHAHFLIGGPGETRETIMKTIDFAVKLNPTTATFGILTVYPGTELHRQLLEKLPTKWTGTQAQLDFLHTKSFYAEILCGLSDRELEGLLFEAYRRFYFRPAYLLKSLANIKSPRDLLMLARSGLDVALMVFTKSNG